MPHWHFRKSKLDAGTECWQLLTTTGEGLSAGQIFSSWRSDKPFRAYWSACLREVPFGSYCWECPPVTVQTLDRPFECVFVSSPLLAELPPDPAPFAEYFSPNCEVVTFDSLGKDALLVAPCPGAERSNYAHLASFLASAPEPQQSALWMAVGNALEIRLSDRPTWLSTAGLGVSWLHARLDTHPKYYRYAPYKTFDQRLR